MPRDPVFRIDDVNSPIRLNGRWHQTPERSHQRKPEVPMLECEKSEECPFAIFFLGAAAPILAAPSLRRARSGSGN